MKGPELENVRWSKGNEGANFSDLVVICYGSFPVIPSMPTLSRTTVNRPISESSQSKDGSVGFQRSTGGGNLLMLEETRNPAIEIVNNGALTVSFSDIGS